MMSAGSKGRLPPIYHRGLLIILKLFGKQLMRKMNSAGNAHINPFWFLVQILGDKGVSTNLLKSLNQLC